MKIKEYSTKFITILNSIIEINSNNNYKRYELTDTLSLIRKDRNTIMFSSNVNNLDDNVKIYIDLNFCTEKETVCDIYGSNFYGSTKLEYTSENLNREDFDYTCTEEELQCKIFQLSTTGISDNVLIGVEVGWYLYQNRDISNHTIRIRHIGKTIDKINEIEMAFNRLKAKFINGVIKPTRIRY